MPKVEIILTSNIVGLGAESDHVKVNPGYARNYLFPQGLAIPLTGANKKRLEALRRRRAEREAHELNTMMELAKGISKLVLIISVKTGDDGKMFGSVTSGSIADALKTQLDVALDKRKIHLERPIHSLGEHEIELRLHAEVRTTLKVVVKSSNPLPEAPAAAGDDKKDSFREKRSSRNQLNKKEGAAEPAAEEAKPAKAPKAAKK